MVPTYEVELGPRKDPIENFSCVLLYTIELLFRPLQSNQFSTDIRYIPSDWQFFVTRQDVLTPRAGGYLLAAQSSW